MKGKIAFILVLVLLSSCSYLQEYKETREVLGTFATITVMDSSKEHAELAIEAGFAEIERLNNVMSRYNPNSEVFILNEEGILENPSLELVYVLKKAEYYSVLSDGAFDITVLPVLNFYKEFFSNSDNEGKFPSDAQINEVLAYVDYKGVFSNKTLIKLNQGTKITIDGIAKGYIIDSVVKVLKKNGIKDALVNIGGDMKGVGEREWNIALQNPRDAADYIKKFEFKNKAIATSGDYERYFVPDKKVHHILNPETGKSATELISVTIIADKAIDADALATAVFVLEEKEGMELVKKLGVEVLIITKEKELFAWP